MCSAWGVLKSVHFSTQNIAECVGCFQCVQSSRALFVPDTPSEGWTGEQVLRISEHGALYILSHHDYSEVTTAASLLIPWCDHYKSRTWIWYIFIFQKPQRQLCVLRFSLKIIWLLWKNRNDSKCLKWLMDPWTPCSCEPGNTGSLIISFISPIGFSFAQSASFLSVVYKVLFSLQTESEGSASETLVVKRQENISCEYTFRND